MYQVNETKFDSFFQATRAAQPLRANVVEVETGNVRWSPAPAVSSKKLRRYAEQKAAYAAQCRMNEGA